MAREEPMSAAEPTLSPEVPGIMEIRRPNQSSLWLWARTCPTRGCSCRDAMVTVTSSGPSAAAELRARVLRTFAVARSHTALAQALDPDVPCALLDIDTGELGDLSGEGSPGHAAFAELAGHVHGDMLDELGRMWFRGKRERVPEGDRKPLSTVSPWKPGDLVAFEDVFVPVREDMFILDGRAFLAVDNHCPEPTCECRQVIVEFVPSRGKEVAAMRVQPDGSCEPERGDPERLHALWAAYVRRYPGFLERLRARTEIMRSFGRDFREWSRKRSVTPVGRNAPCPCGSGKKYKKCCWLDETSSSVSTS
jgi:hypothetical protein